MFQIYVAAPDVSRPGKDVDAMDRYQTSSRIGGEIPTDAGFMYTSRLRGERRMINPVKWIHWGEMHILISSVSRYDIITLPVKQIKRKPFHDLAF